MNTIVVIFEFGTVTVYGCMLDGTPGRLIDLITVNVFLSTTKYDSPESTPVAVGE